MTTDPLDPRREASRRIKLALGAVERAYLALCDLDTTGSYQSQMRDDTYALVSAAHMLRDHFDALADREDGAP